MKSMLSDYFPRMRFEDTSYEPFQQEESIYKRFASLTPQQIEAGDIPGKAPADIYEYNNFFWDAAKEKYKDFTAALNYEKGWNFEMHARPSSGDRMRSSFGKGMPEFLKFFCINSYHFTYDAIFPVEIIITDPSAFDNRGLSFRFAVPVMIDHNKGNRRDFAISIYEDPEADSDYCAAREKKTTIIYAKDRRQKTEDIYGANITFECMDNIQCYLGQTKPEAGTYRLEANLPSFCRPGTLIAEKPGYQDAKQPISLQGDTAVIYMTPIKNFNFILHHTSSLYNISLLLV